MRKTLFLAFLLASIVQNGQAAWYEGGTLHRASLAEWSTATERDRLATSADFFLKMAEISRPDLYKKILGLRSKENFSKTMLINAHEMNTCITTAIKGLNGKVSDDIATFAGVCFLMLNPQ